MDPRIQRTAYAAQAATLADQFGDALADCRVGAHRAEMTAPEASTAGGIQALQHIRLVPPFHDTKGHTYVVGNANRIGRVAELRSLDYIDKVSLERFGERTGFDPGQYGTFLAAATEFLENFGLTVTYATKAVSLSVRPAAGADSGSRVRPQRMSGLVLAVVLVWSFALLAIGVAVGMASHARPGH